MKRILIFLDGTWNTERGDRPVTNIVQLRELVDFQRSGDSEAAEERIRHRIYYDEGVGTGLFDRHIGGALGLGLEENIREAYRFLSQTYDAGDEIFIFGYSRGAFTARSLAGYVGASGLLRREQCTPSLEQAAWRYYRTPPKERYPADRAALGSYVHSSRELRIKCLGVFDTVGALGIPLTVLNGFNRFRYQFHDTNLSSTVDHSFQALSVDERRGPFRPAIWNRPLHNEFRTVEQVWFAGGHADVGGGNAEAADARSLPLSAIPLDWMIKRIESVSTLRFHDRSHWALDSKAAQHDAYGFPYRLFGPTLRVINKIPPQDSGGTDLATLPKHLSPIGEALHASVLERIGHTVTMNERRDRYLPVNVLALLDAIRRTYTPGTGERATEADMKVADYSGEVLAPDDPKDASRVLDLLDKVRLAMDSDQSRDTKQENPPAA